MDDVNERVLRGIVRTKAEIRVTRTDSVDTYVVYAKNKAVGELAVYKLNPPQYKFSVYDDTHAHDALKEGHNGLQRG